ncbi:potassium channel family protein [Ornithinibacillus halophilus]|uniref:Potassium channel LctB n=1 Tax=Ornithinibacillus halophilus TaxID=930117 RepID=A0A1M5KJF7_9BACI|nr:potassium channel family protein [Ornithinibacillus halophilus]SHG52956.1 potassium channel LctB [Ornithinibacillus halophilus]
MSIIAWVFIFFISFILLRSIASFINKGMGNLGEEMRGSYFSIEIFYTLLVTYVIIIIGFGLIYLILSFEGIILVENGELRDVNVVGSIIHSMYFSGVTLLTIGYGDITPIGIGRLIALIQALIGYVLPTAFVLVLVQNTRGRRRNY